MTSFRAVFLGNNANGSANLWVSGGTTENTSDFTTAGTYSELVSSTVNPDFTVFGNDLFFKGTDASYHYNLWVTDGTTAGTSELLVNGEYAYGLLYGVDDPDFSVLGNEVLFAGVDADGHIGLWVTNGTGTETVELNAVGASSGGVLQDANLYSPDFTVLGNEALFVGTDASGATGLWITNGTTAGTSEITVVGTSSSWVTAPDFTVLGNDAIFAATNSSGIRGLWETNGTSPGTTELNVTGAYGSGLFFDNLQPDFAVLGGKLLFEGYDANGHAAPWVTDGTAAGTSELSVAGGYSANTIASQGPHFTVFGNEAVFLALNASDVATVGVTDGTAAGSSALTVGNAYAGGLFDWSTTANPEFTALGNQVLFEGEDASGNLGLWVTNGTAFGTSEITGIANAYPGGLFASGANPDFTTNGNVVLFDGYDSSGHLQLWETNGTAAGTTEVVPAGADPTGLNPSNFAFLPVSYQPATADFTGNGISDILWQNTGGQSAAWLMNGTTPTSEALVGGNPGPSWQIAGTGDFTGNGISDILWQNTDGQAAIWLMNGTNPTSEALAGGNPGSSWKIAGTGDFTGSGISDILWQNTEGQAAIWLMNGTTPTSEALVGSNPGSSWKIAGTGDFTGNGVSDILWQNTDGQAAIWLMNGTNPTSEALVGNNPGSSWKIVGTGDFTGNGLSDILWQNSNGQAAIWLMNGTTPTTESLVGANPGSSWHIVGTGDYTGNGVYDILWQNTNGQAAIWLMNGTTPVTESLVGNNPGTSWHIATGA
jgi:hypothetical protein